MRKLVLSALLLLTFIPAIFASTCAFTEVKTTSIDLKAGLENPEYTLLVARFDVTISEGSDPYLTFTPDADWMFEDVNGHKIPYGLEIDIYGENGTLAATLHHGYNTSGTLDEIKGLSSELIGQHYIYGGENFYVEVRLILMASYEKFYPIYASDGYTSTITAHFLDGNSTTDYSLNLTGFYNEEEANTAVYLNIIPASNALSMNISELLNKNSIEIGTYEFAAVSTISSSQDNTESPYYIYALGSSIFDDERAPHFRLSNTSDATSSFNYTVTLTSYSGSNKSFSGYFQNIDKDTVGNFLQTGKRVETSSDGMYINTFYDAGTISIKADSNSIPSTLSAGYYESTIYFHVVSTK